MCLGIKSRFVRASSVPIDTHGEESLVLTNGDKKVMMHSNCGVIVDYSGCHGWRGNRTNDCWTRLGLF